MTNDKGPLEILTATTKRTSERIANQTQGAMESYFGWLQKTMSASPWDSTDLNTKLLNYATENATAAFTFVQKLSQAKNLQDVVEKFRPSLCRCKSKLSISAQKSLATRWRLRPRDALISRLTSTAGANGSRVSIRTDIGFNRGGVVIRNEKA